MADQINIVVKDSIPPENIATVDKGGQVGNVDTKVQVNQKLDDLKTELVQIVKSDFKGNLAPTDPAPTEDGSYKPTISSMDANPSEPANYGTLYANAGNLRAKKGFSTMFYKKGTTWTKSEEEMPAALKNVPKLSEIIFPAQAGTQAVDQDQLWEVKSGQTATSTDLPTLDSTSKWKTIGLNQDSKFTDFIHPILEVGAIALNTGSPATSTTRGRTVSFIDIANLAKIELTGDMLFQAIFYYNDSGVYVPNSRQDINAKVFIPTIPATATKGKIAFIHTDGNQAVTQYELNSLVVNCYAATGTSLKKAVENANNSTEVTKSYNELTVNLADGVYKELGAVDVNSGALVDSTTRIRTEKIPVKSGKYTITQDAGYVLSRVVSYKDSSFVGWGSAAEFTIDDTVTNYIILVWSKTVNTTVITQAEVDAFKFTLYNLTISKLVQWKTQSDSKLKSANTWFYKKKMSSIGDSITYGFAPRNHSSFGTQIDSYAKVTADILGMIFDNQGKSGSTIGQLSSNPTANDPMVDRVSLMAADARLVTFNGGVNDLRKIHVLGTMTDRTSSTFYGALHVLIQALLNKYIYSQNQTLYKDVLIVGVTPIKTYPDNPISGLTLQDYVNAFIKVCEYYSLPFFDANTLSGIVPGEFRTLQGTDPTYNDLYNPFITDGTHPIPLAHKNWAEKLAGFVKTLIH